MALTERFLNDVHLGDQVSLVVGPKEITGIVDYIDSTLVQVKKENGILSTISIDSISLYEISAKVDDKRTVVRNQTPNSSPAYSRTDNRTQNREFVHPKTILTSFIEAIRNNNKPDEATQNLVEYCINGGKYSEAAKYLGQYGQQHLSEDVYESLKRRLIEIDPSLEYRILDHEDREKIKSDDVVNYFELGLAADREKDLEQAAKYYEEAIKQNQMMSSVIPNLAQIYTRLQRYDDALELLDKYGDKYMERSKYLNVRISVLGAAKNKNHEQDIWSTYREAIFLTKNVVKKMYMYVNEGNLFNEIGNYDKALYIFTQTEKRIDTVYFPEKEKGLQLKLSILIGISAAFSGKGNAEKMNFYDRKVREQANLILRDYPENDMARNIVMGPVESDDETINEVTLSCFIKDQIDQINLEDEIRNKTMIEDGIFTGTPEDAQKIINGIVYKQVNTGVNNEIQSNYYFTIAKLIGQIVDRKEVGRQSIIFSERNYQIQAAIGSLFYGNYQLYRVKNFTTDDIARYCYLCSISVFNHSDKIHNCWAAATIRFLQTFFYSVSEMKTQYGNYLNNNTYKKNYESIIEEIMQRDLIAPVDIFISSLIEMLYCNNKIKDIVLGCIYNNDAVVNSVCMVLKKIHGNENQLHEVNNINDFISLWNETTDIFLAQRNGLLDKIHKAISSGFIIGQLRENYNTLITDRFSDFISQTDKEFLQDIKLILAKLLRYNEESEFDYKAETLTEVENTRRRLVEKIMDRPTYIGYEKLLPILNDLEEVIFEESRHLYGDSQPEITVEVSGNCSIDEADLVVRVPIAFRNKKNVQNADNVTIRIEGEDLIVTNDEQLRRGLLVGNGNAQEELFEFKVTPEILSEQNITALISIQYQYKTSMTDTKDGNVEIPISISLHENSVFQPIKNKFEPYRNGAEVKDISMFYGRDNDIENIIQQISDDNGNVLQGRCLALYGQTRTGKSSLLYHLERRLREIDEERIVIVNIGSIGEENLTGNDISEFLYTIIDELKNEIDSLHPGLKKILSDNEIDINPDEILDNPDHAELYFNKVFREINRCVEKENLNYNMIVMIDEFTYIYDWIRQGTMTNRIMKFWKAFIQNNSIFAVIIGQDHMMKFVEDRQFTNDFGSTDTRKVTYLPEEDAKRLMYEPIMLINERGEKINRYKEGALDRLYELTAGSAFLIMNLCAGLVDYLNGIQSDFITKAHIEDYLKKNLRYFEEARYFEPQYADKSNIFNDETNDANKRILRRIAQLSNKKEWTPLSSVIKTEEDRRLIDALEKRDVLIISNNDRCKIKVALYKEWIIERYGLEGNYE